MLELLAVLAIVVIALVVLWVIKKLVFIVPSLIVGGLVYGVTGSLLYAVLGFIGTMIALKIIF